MGQTQSPQKVLRAVSNTTGVFAETKQTNKPIKN